MSASLLHVTDAAMLINTRDRAVWTTADKKLFTRFAKIVNMHGDKLWLRCGNPTCPEPRIVLFEDDTAPGGRVLRCACTDRIFSPTC